MPSTEDIDATEACNVVGRPQRAKPRDRSDGMFMALNGPFIVDLMTYFVVHPTDRKWVRSPQL